MNGVERGLLLVEIYEVAATGYHDVNIINSSALVEVRIHGCDTDCVPE
jgi:hypothetical protein